MASDRTIAMSGNFTSSLHMIATNMPWYRNFNRLDGFAAFNLALFLLLASLRYHDRFVHYFGSVRVHEFFIYACGLAVGIGWLWWTFRRYLISVSVLFWVQVGIAMHFMGAFVLIGEGRLYDLYLLGLRYDKYVHVVNAMAITALVIRLLRLRINAPVPLDFFHALAALLIVLGLGAVIEIVEYLVVLTVPGNGVGGYDNNMQDLMANLFGSGLCALAHIRRI